MVTTSVQDILCKEYEGEDRPKYKLLFVDKLSTTFVNDKTYTVTTANVLELKKRKQKY